MNRKINILWIEDNLSKTVKRFQKEVKNIIEKAYYKVDIINVKEMYKTLKSNEEFGENILKSHHIDLIFSDNSLPNNEEGIDFLTKYRLSGEYKYYILYSSLNENDIIKKISDKLNENKKVHLFSNFDFISLKNWEDRIDDSIKAFLNNRSKIEELRNMYIVENALIEDELESKSTGRNYKKLIENYVSDKPEYGNIKVKWDEVRKDRNVLAHGRISFENGVNIVTGKNGRVVSENDFEAKVNALKELDEALKNLNFFSQYLI